MFEERNDRIIATYKSANLELHMIKTHMDEILVRAFNSFNGEMLFEECFGFHALSIANAMTFIEINFTAKEVVEK